MRGEARVVPACYAVFLDFFLFFTFLCCISVTLFSIPFMVMMLLDWFIGLLLIGFLTSLLFFSSLYYLFNILCYSFFFVFFISFQSG